jgi:ribosomal protein L37AE/L43A
MIPLMPNLEETIREPGLSLSNWGMSFSFRLGSKAELQREHIVPKSLAIRPECRTCDVIRSIHNQIWACGGCNSLKGTKRLYEFYRAKSPGERKFYDLIPPLLDKKYLKTIFNCHQCAGTLDADDVGRDAELTVLEIDSIAHKA